MNLLRIAADRLSFQRSAARRFQGGFTLVELLVVIAIIGILVSLLLPAVQAARESARRMQCSNSLKQLVLATHNYATSFGTLPPGTIRTDLGNGGGINETTPTWIARILPQMEQQALYDKIDWNELPGHGGTNADLLGIELPFTHCPSDVRTRPDPTYAPTNYVACIGNSDETLPNRPHDGAFYVSSFTQFAHIRDGLSNTMLLSECMLNAPWIKRYAGDTGGYASCLAGTLPDMTANDTGSGGRGKSWFYGRWSQCWTFSTRLPPNDRLSHNHECELWTHQGVYAARSRHPGGVQVGLGDGAVLFVSESIGIDIWQALGSIKGGEIEVLP